MRRGPGTMFLQGALVLAGLAVGAGAPVAAAAPLVDRLPAGASLVAEADLAAIRKASVIDQAAWAASGGPEILEQAGVSFRRDVDRVAVAILPALAAGKPSDTVALLAGRFDRSRIERALAGNGAKGVKLGDVAAQRIEGSASLSLHPGLPEIDMEGQQVFVSFLGDLLMLGSERGTRVAHGPKEGLPSPALAAARASVPSNATAWVAVDASHTGSSDGLTQGLKSITAWGLVGETLQLQALARAADGNRAKQLAGLAGMLAGVAASTQDGQILSGLDIAAKGDAVEASLTLTREQVHSLSGGKPDTAASAAPLGR